MVEHSTLNNSDKNNNTLEECPMTVTQKIMYLLFRIRAKMYIIFTTSFARFQLRLWGASIGADMKVKGFLVLSPLGKIKIGDNVRINSAPIHVGGSDRRTAFRIGRRGILTIKDRVGMSNTTINCFNSVTIGEDVLIGGGCEIMDTDFHQISHYDRIKNKGCIPSAPIVIEKKAFVGGMSIIKKGVTIGEGSLIGTGSLVVKNVPPYEIWAGVPAKFIKKIKDN